MSTESPDSTDGFADFDRYCDEHDIKPGEEAAAFAAWLHEGTGWDGKVSEATEVVRHRVAEAFGVPDEMLGEAHVYYCICGPDHEDDACPEHGECEALGLLPRRPTPPQPPLTEREAYWERQPCSDQSGGHKFGIAMDGHARRCNGCDRTAAMLEGSGRDG